MPWPQAGGYDRRMSSMPAFPLLRRVPPGASTALVGLGGGPRPVGLFAAAADWRAYLAMAGLIAATAILLRRRPLSTLALLLACAVALVLAPRAWQAALMPLTFARLLPSLPALLILLVGVAVCFIAVSRPRRISIAAAITALATLVACLLAGRLLLGFRIGIFPLLTVALLTVIAWLIGNSVRQNHVHAETLRAQAEAQAVTAERLRIARELHDMIAHSIGNIAIQAGMGSRVIDTCPAEARSALGAIEETSRETLAGLRRMLCALRRAGPAGEAGPAPLDPAPGLADVGGLAAAATDAGVRVDVQWRGQRYPLPADIDLSAFRIIQEAVTNVVRHAGASHCRVVIEQQDEELAIEVVDDGRGCGTGAGSAGTGYGITGMRERTALLHGHFSAGPRPGGGFRVAARLPVPSAEPVPAGVR
jgi:signal transduction histidine kinase